MCGRLVRLWSISCFVCLDCHVVWASASLQCKRGILKKNVSFVSYTRTNNKCNDTKHFYENISFFTAVYNHWWWCSHSRQSDTLVQTWERSSNLLSHLHTADPEQCEVSVNVGLSVSEKSSFVKVSDKSNLFQKLQSLWVNVMTMCYFVSGFSFSDWFQTKCITLLLGVWGHVKTMSTVMWILGVSPSR